MIRNNLRDYFSDHTLRDFFYDSLIDHYKSQALMYGMWGNSLMSFYFDSIAKMLDKNRPQDK